MKKTDNRKKWTAPKLIMMSAGKRTTSKVGSVAPNERCQYVGTNGTTNYTFFITTPGTACAGSTLTTATATGMSWHVTTTLNSTGPNTGPS